MDFGAHLGPPGGALVTLGSILASFWSDSGGLGEYVGDIENG